MAYKVERIPLAEMSRRRRKSERRLRNERIVDALMARRPQLHEIAASLDLSDFPYCSKKGIVVEPYNMEGRLVNYAIQQWFGTHPNTGMMDGFPNVVGSYFVEYVPGLGYHLYERNGTGDLQLIDEKKSGVLRSRASKKKGNGNNCVNEIDFMFRMERCWWGVEARMKHAKGSLDIIKRSMSDMDRLHPQTETGTIFICGQPFVEANLHDMAYGLYGDQVIFMTHGYSMDDIKRGAAILYARIAEMLGIKYFVQGTKGAQYAIAV